MSIAHAALGRLLTIGPTFGPGTSTGTSAPPRLQLAPFVHGMACLMPPSVNSFPFNPFQYTDNILNVLQPCPHCSGASLPTIMLNSSFNTPQTPLFDREQVLHSSMEALDFIKTSFWSSLTCDERRELERLSDKALELIDRSKSAHQNHNLLDLGRMQEGRQDMVAHSCCNNWQLSHAHPHCCNQVSCPASAGSTSANNGNQRLERVIVVVSEEFYPDHALAVPSHLSCLNKV
jgi:hypothetical protein